MLILPGSYNLPSGGGLGRVGESNLTGAIQVGSKVSLFLAELKRRRVYHVAAVYVVVGLGVLGAAEVILDPLGLGDLRK